MATATATDYNALSDAIDALEFETPFTINNGEVQPAQGYTPEAIWTGSEIEIYGDWKALPFSNSPGNRELCDPAEVMSAGIARVLEERSEEFTMYALTVVPDENSVDGDNLAGWAVIGKTA